MPPPITITRLKIAEFTLPDWHPRAAEHTAVVFSYLIKHPDGAILVDTGPGSGHPLIDGRYVPRVLSIVDVLHDHGFDERDVTAIVNTHLHFDHCGQNDRFDVPVWVTRAELDTVATTERYTVAEWAHIDPDRRRLAEDNEVIADGVTVLHTPGHTPGHLSIVVASDDGADLIAGQACYCRADFDSGIIDPRELHSEEWRAAATDSLARLRALNPTHVYLSHDAQ